MNLLIGNWSPEKGRKGLSIYEYNWSNGEISFIKNIESDVGISYLVASSSKEVFYATNETDTVENGIFYNQILTFNCNESISVLNRVSSLGPNPTWICEDDKGKYILVSHHGGFSHTCTVAKNINGRLEEKLVYDEPHVILIKLNSDGSCCEATDAFLPKTNKPNASGLMSRTHSINKAIGKNIFFVCDKGLDAIFSISIDYKNNKIIELDKISVGINESPRYGVVHPDKPIVYVNMEGSTNIYALNYDSKGHMSINQCLDICSDKNTNIMPSDIIFNNSHGYIYVGLRGIKSIAIIRLDNAGLMHLVKLVENPDGNPNQLRFSPAGKYLFVTNIFEGKITRFTVKDNYDLVYDGIVAEDNCPASMLFI